MKELKGCVKYLVYWMVDDGIEGLGWNSLCTRWWVKELKSWLKYFVYYMVDEGTEGLGEILSVLDGG